MTDIPRATPEENQKYLDELIIRIRTAMAELLWSNFERIKYWMNELENNAQYKEAARILLRFSEFILPSANKVKEAEIRLHKALPHKTPPQETIPSQHSAASRPPRHERRQAARDLVKQYA